MCHIDIFESYDFDQSPIFSSCPLCHSHVSIQGSANLITNQLPLPLFFVLLIRTYFFISIYFVCFLSYFYFKMMQDLSFNSYLSLILSNKIDLVDVSLYDTHGLLYIYFSLLIDFYWWLEFPWIIENLFWGCQQHSRCVSELLPNCN